MLAISALCWLAGEPERLARFLALTGLDAHDVRAVADSPGFLGTVLDHLLSHEDLLQAFAAHERIAPTAVAAARRKLAGATGDFAG